MRLVRIRSRGILGGRVKVPQHGPKGNPHGKGMSKGTMPKKMLPEHASEIAKTRAFGKQGAAKRRP